MRSPPASAIRVPAALSRFWGREWELGQLQMLLATDRLVTITGAGGVGKTRLALELVRRHGDDFPDAIWLVELAPVERADLVPQVIASAVDAPVDPSAGHLELAAARLADGRQLLVLDNCEHLRPEAAAACESLLALCPNLRVLATSREPLGVEGERAWLSPSLAVPAAGASDVAGVLQAESAQLFCDRAELVDPGFRLTTANVADVVAICRRLDGLPLALELAAAWVPVLSPAQIAARLDDSLGLLTRGGVARLARQRTMRAALDWSHQLLSDAEKLAFAGLSVFVAGFSLEGAEAVLAGGAPENGQALDLLAALVRRSLVVADTAHPEARYRLLEPVRQYGAEQLRTLGMEPAVRRLHLDYLVELAQASEEPLRKGSSQLAWLDRLDAEIGNIRSGLAWGFDNEPDKAARLATALIWYWHMRNLDGEGRGWAERSVPAGGRLRARALHMAGWYAAELGDAGAAARDLAEAHRLMVEGRWLDDLTDVLGAEGTAAYVAGDLATAEQRYAEQLELARELEDETRVMRALYMLGIPVGAGGDHKRASALTRESVAIAQRLGNRWAAAVGSASLAEEALHEDDLATARGVLADGLESIVGLGDDTALAYMVENAGVFAIRGGEPATGLCLLAAARATFDRLRHREAPPEKARRRHWIETARRRVGSDEADAAWRRGFSLTPEAAAAEARAVVAEPIVIVGKLAPLSPRESEVALLVSQGMTAAQIAARLHISERTVENHVHNSLNKLGLGSRAQLAAWVARREDSEPATR